jgi:hypothetical protein
MFFTASIIAGAFGGVSTSQCSIGIILMYILASGLRSGKDGWHCWV